MKYLRLLLASIFFFIVSVTLAQRKPAANLNSGNAEIKINWTVPGHLKISDSEIIKFLSFSSVQYDAEKGMLPFYSFKARSNNGTKYSVKIKINETAPVTDPEEISILKTGENYLEDEFEGTVDYY